MYVHSVVSELVGRDMHRCLQAIEKNAVPVVHDLAQQLLKPAAAAAGSADPAAKQFSEEGIKPAAKIVADNVQPVAKGFTDQTLLPVAHKVCCFHWHVEGLQC